MRIAGMDVIESNLFPINRCHQRVVTLKPSSLNTAMALWGFQSIGVTSEW